VKKAEFLNAVYLLARY